MKKSAAPAPWAFTVLFVAAMFLPRLVPQGLFGDGLLYASMARNLAEGKGSMWAPWFSSGYWLDFASGAPYFENPPLMIWLQAGFFLALGDHWWVEKLYALLLLLLNAWLIVRVWEVPLRGTARQRSFGWFPLLLWYFITPVLWGNPNNLMDNNMLTFCLLALLISTDGLFSGQGIPVKLTIAGLFVFLGFLTKGPVAFYPAAAPFLFAVIFSPRDDSRRNYAGQLLGGALRSGWILLVAAGLFALLLLLVPESRHYFENYWERRLGVVLSGTREDAAFTGWARLSIFIILVKEQAGLIGLFLLLFLIPRRKRVDGSHFRRERKISLFFLLAGFAATLPIMLSARQNGIYVIPGMPMFALAAGYYHLPLLHGWLANPGEKTARFLENLSKVSFAGMFALAVYVFFLFGQPGREKELLHDLPYLRQVIPKGEKVAVCERLMQNQQAHTYFQRFHHLELSRDVAGCRYALADSTCDAGFGNTLAAKGFARIDYPGKTYFVYVKK